MIFLRLIVMSCVLLSFGGCQIALISNEMAMHLKAPDQDIDSFSSFSRSNNSALLKSTQGFEVSNVFQALIKQESGGRNRVVSHAGAVGRTQLMIPTARIMARKLGMEKIAKLPQYRLRHMLMHNPALNEKLGRAYFNEGREIYGRDDLALIYYNGGPRAANAAYRSWKRSGRLYIYTGETYCYVKNISEKAGIDAAPMKLIRGKAYYRNRSRWIRRTGRAPCRT